MLRAPSPAMYYRAAYVPISLLLLLLLAACDSGGSTPAPTPPPTEQASATPAPANPTPTVEQATATPEANPGPTKIPTAGAGEFQNPVLRADFADPFVLKDGDTFYAYATNGSSKNIQEATSTIWFTGLCYPTRCPPYPSGRNLAASSCGRPK